ncbi:alpha/beta hydrolase, partial [Bacillus cereus]|nr:alpha/beta hydrolase [Bacillus cereus]
LIADVKIIEGTHSIYLYAPDEIYKFAMDFINNKVVKN